MTNLTIGLAVGSPNSAALASAAPSVAITGQSVDSMGSYARIGNHAAIGVTVINGPATAQRWGSVQGGSQYGTGASPTNFEGGAVLYAGVRVGGEWYEVSLPIRYQPATAAGGIADQTWIVDDTTISLDTSTDFTANGNTLSYAFSGLPSGAVGAGNGFVSGTPDAPGSGAVIVTATDTYGRTVQSGYDHTTAYRAQATAAGGLGPFDFPENTMVNAQDLSADFAANGNSLTYQVLGAALPTGLNLSSGGSLTGTPTAVTAPASYTVRATDEYGRTTDSTFLLSVTEVAATITINSVSYTAGSGGTAASISLDATYTGSGSLTAFAVTGAGPVTVSDSQLKAGSGGTNTLEFFNFAVSAPTDSDEITGPTATSEAADRIILIVSDGTIDSAQEVIIVSGLDFTEPTISDAVTDTAGNTITLTMSEAVFGTGAVTDWTVNGVSAGTPTIDSVAVNGTTSVVIEISGNLIVNGDIVTVDYAGGNLTDANGNALANVDAEPVTNSVPGGTSINDVATDFSGFDYGDFSDGAQTFTDRAQTSNVTSDGDFVRGHAGYQARINWEDKDGGATRPRWRTTEGVEGEGNDRLRIQGDPNSGPGWFYGVRLKVQELDRLQTVLQIDDVQPIRQNTDNAFLMFGRRASDNGIVSTNIPEATHGTGVGDWVTVMSWQRRNGDFKIYVDGNTSSASLGATAKTFTAPLTTMMVSATSNADHLNGRITRWAALPAMDTNDSDGDLSEAQIAIIKSWLDAG